MLCCTQEDKNPRLYIYYKGFTLLTSNIFLITISSPRYFQPEVQPMQYIYWQRMRYKVKLGNIFHVNSKEERTLEWMIHTVHLFTKTEPDERITEPEDQ